MRNMFSKLLIALCLCASAGFAAAGPFYRVSIDTSALGSGPANLGFTFLSVGDAAPATATISKLTGALAGSPSASGSVTDVLPFVFSNAAGGGDLVQGISLGGIFSFDVSFDLGAGLDGTTFAWSLFNDTAYLGVNGDMGSIFLNPSAPIGEQLSFTAARQFNHVMVIPEPSSVLLLLLAAAGMVAARRARQP